MDRRKISFGIFILLLLLLGLALGFWLGGLIAAVPVTGQEMSGEGEATPIWCCMEGGKDCKEVKEGAVNCLQRGGRLATKNQEKCNGVCRQLKP